MKKKPSGVAPKRLTNRAVKNSACTTELGRRSLGCLYGLAIGDALGAPVEFISRSEIEFQYGELGITDFLPWGGFPAGSYTDDTQMSFATVRGVLRAIRRVPSRGVCDPVSLVHEEYEKWSDKQKEPFYNRVPGVTSLLVLADGVRGTLEDPINESKGCGGVMRTAPAGLFFDATFAFEMGVDFAAITHGHPSGYLPAGFVAEVVANLRVGRTLPRSVEFAVRKLKTYKGHEETLDKVQLARELVAGKVSPARAIPALGQGWVGEEALGIALYCALRHPRNFKAALLTAVNITGDSDSTGSITGAMVGTAVGVEGIPEGWRERVEGRREIGALARSIESAVERVLCDGNP